ncbi:type II secretion system F family protein [Lignipirellula cremea]|uniref:Type II secretion system protein F n=1 Tax=Lignipirellula cremea TaxID=2528010 RepID=A0A518DV88_9BACT|nr:type II secretion system F family protein [Lignipirellula cremea]QDU95749.1 Putative type II secretion system protein F [Lignipirellula cremea]
MGVSYDAGIDLREVWGREVRSARNAPAFQEIAEQIGEGAGLADAMRRRKGYFPRLFVEMVDLGEQTGRLGQVLMKLADHYEHLLRLRRNFLMAIAWPMLQLGAAILVIGGLIWALKALADMDLLGWGLSAGASALVFWLLALAVGALLLTPIYGLSKGWFGMAPLAVAYRVPFLGRNLEMLALSRMAWAMSMANDAGMDAQRMMLLSINATGSPRYTHYIPEVQEQLSLGRPVYESLERTGVFPADFINAVETGEASGMLAENMAHTGEQYREQSQTRSGGLAMLAGFVVWGIIALFMIWVIIYLFQSLYLGPMYDAMQPI